MTTVLLPHLQQLLQSLFWITLSFQRNDFTHRNRLVVNTIDILWVTFDTVISPSLPDFNLYLISHQHISAAPLNNRYFFQDFSVYVNSLIRLTST